MDEGVLIVLAWPKQLKHPHPQCLFVVNWITETDDLRLDNGIGMECTGFWNWIESFLLPNFCEGENQPLIPTKLLTAELYTKIRTSHWLSTKNCQIPLIKRSTVNRHQSFHR